MNEKILGVVWISLFIIVPGLVYLWWKSSRTKTQATYDILVGQTGEVLSFDAPSRKKGQVMVRGEIWRFESLTDLEMGEEIIVTGYKNFVLQASKRRIS